MLNIDGFRKAKRNIEIEIAKENLKLSEQYAVAETDEDKEQLLSKMDSFWSGIIKTGKFRVYELIARLERAIKLDKFRPRNLSIFLLAVNKDLYDISGDFNTFDVTLAKMVKENADPNLIRQKFDVATVNRFTLAEQFAYDWMVRLNKNKKLVDQVRNATTTQDEIDAYDKLFSKLAEDFCIYYKMPRNTIDVQVITDWAKSDFKPDNYADNTFGYHTIAWVMTLPPGTSKKQWRKQKEIFMRSPETYPNAIDQSNIRVNIRLIKNRYQDPKEFFWKMISVFVHEMHHSLDVFLPERGALGPQIKIIDKKTYVTAGEDINEYHKSATELSSYEIDHNLFEQLKNRDY